MYNVRRFKQYADQVVHMSWKASEARFVAHEAMNIDQKKGSLSRALGLLRRD